MKKRKNLLCILLLIFSIAVFIAHLQYEKATNDKIAPELSCETDTITASVSITEEEMLQGVTAQDNRDGDVSDTIVVESVSNFVDTNKRVITYAAIDKDMNVGRIERFLIYTDYEAPTFSLTQPLSYVVGSRINILENVRATSVLDGNVTPKLRYGLSGMIDNLTSGSYPVEFRVTDSCGQTSYLNTEIEIYESTLSGIDVYLKKYLTYIPKGSTFKPDAYFKSSTIEGELSIVNPVDTKTPGTYAVDYYVNATNAAGKSRLIVVVY
ncbi:MAG: hypothetical protein II225_04890 [Ruminococcus sp.]|nr:hypothetical protein [Ruminococcus sp.]